MSRDDAWQSALSMIRNRAQERDISGAWPDEELAALANIGAMRWALPRPYGDDLSALDLHLKYEALSAASLTTALVLSQRDSAVQLIESAEHFARRDEMLRQFADNRLFATIGIAQLTTSRQGRAPALRAEADGDHFRLDGFIPWSTGAGQSGLIAAGAVLPDKQQILFCLPTDLPGVSIDPPMPLASLRATCTTQVNCNHVHLDRALILRPPGQNALAGRRQGVPFGQVYFALGLCRAAIDLIAAHRSDAAYRAHDVFEKELQQRRTRILSLASPDQYDQASSDAAPLRAAVNDLALRATHAAVTLYKGSALLESHPAQRLAREALFLLVWSCPGAVIDCTVDRLMGDERRQ